MVGCPSVVTDRFPIGTPRAKMNPMILILSKSLMINPKKSQVFFWRWILNFMMVFGLAMMLVDSP
jgi:hypothetical protein